MATQEQPESPPINDPLPDPEPSVPSLPGPDPGVFHHEPPPIPNLYSLPL